MTGFQLSSRFLLLPVFLSTAFSFSIPSGFNKQARPTSAEKDRDRAYLRQQFQKNFKSMQLLGQGLLKDHADARLTSTRLEKDAKSIYKCAKTLRALMALGEMAQVIQIENEINTSKKFDDSIRKLAGLIWDFAHNPVHQNSKVFNTDQAVRAQTDLLTIINLSKAIGSKSKSYSPPAMQN